MKCEKAREFILTDYLDGELKKDEKLEVERHIASCAGCSKLLIDVKDRSARYFKGAQKFYPSENVWANIKERIKADAAEKRGAAVTVTERLKRLFYIPRTAGAFATLAVIVLIVSSVFIHNVKRAGGFSAENGSLEYFGQMFADNEADSGNGFGTSIEEYFL